MSLRGDEVVVGAGDLEGVNGLAVGCESLGVREPDAQGGGAVGLEFGGGFAEERRGVGQVGFAIDHVAGGEGEAVADGLLVGRVDVVGVADVEGDGHGGIGDGEGAALGIADAAPVFLRRIEAGNLDEEERQIPLGEVHAPVANERREERVSNRGRGRAPELVSPWYQMKPRTVSGVKGAIMPL